ncbi:MAG: hypothetical protein K2Q10_04920 [Rhodospirillales bacterium]|nr:hypothetical protein [Rhodospirillales bacterium]
MSGRILAGLSLALLLTSAGTVNAAAVIPIEPCGAGSDSIDRVAALGGSGIALHAGPGSDKPRIGDAEAARLVGKAVDATLDRSMTVREQCRRGEWSRVTVEEPKALRESHQGWVLTQALRLIVASTDGARVFSAGDFAWTHETMPHKTQILRKLNHLPQDNKLCAKLNPASLGRSPTRSTADNPVFFVTCGEGPQAVNIYFSKAEMGK